MRSGNLESLVALSEPALRLLTAAKTKKSPLAKAEATMLTNTIKQAVQDHPSVFTASAEAVTEFSSLVDAPAQAIGVLIQPGVGLEAAQLATLAESLNTEKNDRDFSAAALVFASAASRCSVEEVETLNGCEMTLFGQEADFHIDALTMILEVPNVAVMRCRSLCTWALRVKLDAVSGLALEAAMARLIHDDEFEFVTFFSFAESREAKSRNVVPLRMRASSEGMSRLIGGEEVLIAFICNMSADNHAAG